MKTERERRVYLKKVKGKGHNIKQARDEHGGEKSQTEQIISKKIKEVEEKTWNKKQLSVGGTQRKRLK